MAKLARSKLSAVIADKLATLPADQLAQEVAAYLLETRRSGELNSLMRDVMQHRADAGTVEVTAVTDHPIQPQTRGDIEAEVRRLYPAAKTVIVSERHDPDVVGGVRLELANQQLDLSVRAKLNRLRQLTTAGA